MDRRWGSCRCFGAAIAFAPLGAFFGCSVCYFVWAFVGILAFLVARLLGVSFEAVQLGITQEFFLYVGAAVGVLITWRVLWVMKRGWLATHAERRFRLN